MARILFGLALISMASGCVAEGVAQRIVELENRVAVLEQKTALIKVQTTASGQELVPASGTYNVSGGGPFVSRP